MIGSVYCCVPALTCSAREWTQKRNLNQNCPKQTHLSFVGPRGQQLVHPRVAERSDAFLMVRFQKLDSFFSDTTPDSGSVPQHGTSTPENLEINEDAFYATKKIPHVNLPPVTEPYFGRIEPFTVTYSLNCTNLYDRVRQQCNEGGVCSTLH